MERIEALRSLLLNLFPDSGALRRQLRSHAKLRLLDDELPGAIAGRAQVVDAVVELLHARGLGLDFIDALLAEDLYEGRRAELKQVRALWERGATQPSAPSSSASSTVRQQIINNGPVGRQFNVAGDATIHPSSPTPGLRPMAEKTKLLFLAANPMGKGRLRLDQEFRRVSKALEGSTHSSQVEVHHWPEAHLKDLPSKLSRLEPSVVHFSGHGDFGGKLVLFDAQGKLKAMEPKAIAGLLGRRSKTLRLVVLNACHSGELAEALVEKIDFVVGTSDSIADSAAAQFAETFYEALWDGASVQDAFDDACDVVAGEVPGEEDILKLYSRDGVNPSEVKLADPQ